MLEAVILYSHFMNDEISRNHRDLLRMHNPYPVVPLFCDDGMGGSPLEDAVNVPMTYTRGRNWHNIDWTYREWFLGPNKIEAERYICFDWDCYANMPLKEWYGANWDQDFVVAERVKSEDHWWWWFKMQREFLPHNLVDHACGVVPLNGVLLSRKAMDAYSKAIIPEGIFCEFRLATVLASLGIYATQLAEDQAKTNIFLEDKKSLAVNGRGVFHPVKYLVSKK